MTITQYTATQANNDIVLPKKAVALINLSSYDFTTQHYVSVVHADVCVCSSVCHKLELY